MLMLHPTIERRTAIALVLLLTVVALAAAGAVGRGRQAEATHPYADGSASECSAWRIALDLLFVDLPIKTIAEEGWVWANGTQTTDKFRDASGVVTKSKAAHNDTPGNHFSHDWNVDIRIDPGQEGLLSNVNGPNSSDAATYQELVPPQKIELEWETGVTPGETTGDGASPYLPRWVLPNLGDRVWTNGHWVFDCGHGKKVGSEWVTVEVNGVETQVLANAVEHFRTEIHPGRTLATMRQQAGTLPGSGTTNVPVTATDLYVHGRGAFMVQQLECGIDTILVEITHSCPIKTTPIDAQYEFDICLPPKQSPWAQLAWSVAPGPDDSGVVVQPQVASVQAAGGCLLPADEFGNDFDDGVMLHVSLNLEGSGIEPTEVYSRKIVAGWLEPPSDPLPHLSLKLDRLDLHQDHEADPFDGEFTFWWMGIDRAPTDEWHRLVNYEIPTYDDSWSCFEHTNVLNDMDDDQLCGDGLLDFSGPTWDLYLLPTQSLNVHTTGFEQDCYDDHFGSGHFDLLDYVDCHFGNFFTEFTNDYGNNDPIEPLDAPLVAVGTDPLSVLGHHRVGNGEFHFDFTLTEVPQADEDDADLSITKSCAGAGEVALVGEPVVCTIVVSNAGPGLPRDVVITDTLTTDLAPSDYAVGAATFHVGDDSTAYACGSSSATGFTCAVGTVPVGGTVTIQVSIAPLKPGDFSNLAAVSTESGDEVSANDEADADVKVHLPVPVDIQPGSLTNPVNLNKQGLLTVAILTGADFDAASLAVAIACFGDSGAPSQRTCQEQHGEAHYVDADRDKDKDLVFHFSVPLSGIDIGDTTACLIGTTSDGIGFYGCDVVVPF